MMQRFIWLFLAIALISALYLFWRVGKLIQFYAKNMRPKFAYGLDFLITAVVAALAGNFFSTRGVVAIHFIAAFVVMDLLALVLFLLHLPLRHREKGKAYLYFSTVYRSGIIPVICALVLVIYGWFNMRHIVQTNYTFSSPKLNREYSVVLLTDIHYDSVQNPEILQEALEEIEEVNPDIVILGGDIVEEGTSRERMEEVFALLGALPNRYGVYYVYGNHDRQPYTNQRTYTNEELEAAIRESGIQILQDVYVEIGDDLLLAGREGAAWGNVSDRKSPPEILEGADRGRYVIMADHQPVEAEENDAAGVDLEVAGHTHAGQIWPTGLLTELSGGYNYGHYRQGNCDVVVSSGIAGWTYTIRTGEHCEYVTIRLLPGE